MKIYREEIKKVIDNVDCDCCGKSCDTINMGPSWASLGATWGYGCINDGIDYDIDLCEDCFMEILDFIKEKRRKVLGQFNYPHEKDPLDGRCYFP